MYFVGKININIYKCVTEDITTDDAIITDNQILHIKEHHPNDFEKYMELIPDILASPDYILEANKPYTAFLLREFENNGKSFQLILRLKTSKDPDGYKNSIITFLKIDKKRYERYLRTKKILYNKFLDKQE